MPARSLAAQDEAVLAIEAGYGLTHGPGSSTGHGVGASATVWLGLTDSLWLAASGGATHELQRDAREEDEDVQPQEGSEPQGATVGEVAGGLVLALDVLRTIPFVEGLIALEFASGRIVPTFRVGLGADYLVTKAFSLGGVARYRPLSEDAGWDGLLTVHLRAGLRFDL